MAAKALVPKAVLFVPVFAAKELTPSAVLLAPIKPAAALLLLKATSKPSRVPIKRPAAPTVFPVVCQPDMAPEANRSQTIPLKK